MRRLVATVLVALTVAPAAGAADDPGRADQWALDRIGTGRGDGRGITVAVIDSGIDLGHVDLRDQLVPGIDLVDGDDVAQDANGHGTHVAGIIAASAGNGVGIAGVAPGVSLMPVRVLGADGAGTIDGVVAGIRFAVEHGADVLNLSLSEDAQAVLGPSLSGALREAWDAGVVPVIAAGNQYVLGSGFADEPAIVVAATTRDDGKPSYSSAVGSARWGMSAPGGEQPVLGEDGAILSTYWVAGKTDQYAYDCGTSMAAPHVSGAIAVLLGLGLSPQAAVDRVLSTARDIGAPGHDTTFGAGLLDLAAATDGITTPNGASAPHVPDPVPARPPSSPPRSTATSELPDLGPAPTVTVEPPVTSTTLGVGTPTTLVAIGVTSEETAAEAPSTTIPALAAGALALAVLVALARARRGQVQREAG